MNDEVAESVLKHLEKLEHDLPDVPNYLPLHQIQDWVELIPFHQLALADFACRWYIETGSLLADVRNNRDLALEIHFRLRHARDMIRTRYQNELFPEGVDNILAELLVNAWHEFGIHWAKEVFS